MKVQQLIPFGALVLAENPGQSILDLDRDMVTELLNNHMIVLFRQFAPCDDEEYIEFANRFGELLKWEFGEILELKIRPDPSNHIFANARVELHWDGAFVEAKPHYNVFQCVYADAAERGGETLFVNTPKVVDSASAEERLHWEKINIHYKTEKKAHYGGSVCFPLCSVDAGTGKETIRYIEAFNEDNAEVNPIDIRVVNCNRADSDRFLRSFTKRLYKNDVMYRHRWQQGDYLIADNNVLLHGRSRFTLPTPNRHIKRINVL